MGTEKGGSGPVTVHCAVCRAEWALPMKLPMPLRRAVPALKGFAAAGCPQCGARGDKVMCAPLPDDERWQS